MWREPALLTSHHGRRSRGYRSCCQRFGRVGASSSMCCLTVRNSAVRTLFAEIRAPRRCQLAWPFSERFKASAFLELFVDHVVLLHNPSRDETNCHLHNRPSYTGAPWLLHQHVNTQLVPRIIFIRCVTKKSLQCPTAHGTFSL